MEGNCNPFDVKKFRLPVPCETSFFLSAAQRMLSGWEFFPNVFFLWPSPPPPFSKTLGSAGRRWLEPGGDWAWPLSSSPGGGQVERDLCVQRTHPGCGPGPRPLEALGWKCIYTLNNTLNTSVSQLLAFEHRYNRILQAT